MEVIQTPLSGLLLIKPKVFGDTRGYFFESYQESRYQDLQINCHFVQDNISRSEQGVLRGLHFQNPHTQSKLVTVLRGEIFDVAVDIRKGSPTFGQSYAVTLNDTNHWQLFIPEGFAHGFYVLSEWADFHYKCSDYYHPESEQGVAWDDPALQIDWPILKNSTPVLSQKDQNYTPLANVSSALLPDYSS